MPYVVCQTKRCAQTYSFDELGVITKETKNIACKKCGGVVIDENGRGLLSQYPDVLPGYDPKEAAKERRRLLREKRQARARIDAEINELEQEEKEESEECST